MKRPADLEAVAADWARRLDAFCADLEAAGMTVCRTGPLSVRIFAPGEQPRTEAGPCYGPGCDHVSHQAAGNG